MKVQVEKGVSLKELNTLGVDASAQNFVVVNNEGELAEVFTQDFSDVIVLGGGSNLLFADGLFKGLVVKVGILGFEYTEQNAEGVLLRVGAGEVLDEVVSKTVADGYWGLENLSYIPGSVGATPVQNVGAYGVEVKDLIDSVRVFDRVENVFKNLSPTDCRFGYRDSIFKKEVGRYVIVEVVFRLSKLPCPKIDYKDLQKYFADTQPQLSDVREAIIDIRSQKFPDWSRVGTAGSFFKNPIVSSELAQDLKNKYPEIPLYELSDGTSKLALGWVLDKVLNLKGVQEGYVGTYKNQALVLVAYPGATAKMIDEFSQKVIDLVFQKTGVVVEREVTKVGGW